MRKILSSGVAILAVCLVAVPGQAQSSIQPTANQAQQSSRPDPQVLAYLNWTFSALPPKAETQAAIFAYIEKRVGHKIVQPVLPQESPDDVLNWYSDRWIDFDQKEDEQAYADKHLDEIYTRCAEDLMAAQQMLQNPSFQWQYKGLTLVQKIALRGPLYTRDTWLGARIYEGFVLPYLNLADVNPTYGQSWSFMLQDAAARFKKNQEYEKQISVLQIHISIETMAGRRDNSRKHIAWTLEELGRFEEAIEVWETIENDLFEKTVTIKELKAKISSRQQQAAR